MADEDGELTIDELARRVGMSVRNVRAHQSRGLLPPPVLRGRTGYYGAEHVARLELVKDLQAEGFNLEAIRQILERTPGSSVADVLGFTRAVAEPFTDEEPEIVSLAELGTRWGDGFPPALVERVVKLGFLRPVGDDKVEVVSPRLERAANELAELGIRPEAAVEVLSQLRRHAEAMAKAYVRLFVEEVLRPTQEGEDAAPERWDEVRGALDRLRPLAGESLVAVFQVVMTEQVERALERELARMGSGKRGR